MQRGGGGGREEVTADPGGLRGPGKGHGLSPGGSGSGATWYFGKLPLKA